MMLSQETRTCCPSYGRIIEFGSLLCFGVRLFVVVATGLQKGNLVIAQKYDHSSHSRLKAIAADLEVLS
ncbi:hypothetical protein [Chitinilyticum aquatile]|uniref:hypothetical protein n=1 Tax=Chitinilyticum aquatile TaxID=362520 RepID=UPI000490A776|nr:hypothetical protein [Chitinilyticum aquatile]